MEQYILPLFCLLLNFVAVAACIRFLCAREGLFWIMPLVLSSLFFFQNGSIMYSHGTLVQSALSAGALIDALIAISWYIIIITFHYALKKTSQKNNYKRQVKKDLAESRYILKSEQIENERIARKRIRQVLGGARTYDRGLYSATWCDYFDQR